MTGGAWPEAGPRPTVRREVGEALEAGMTPSEVAGRAKRSLSVVLGVLELQGWPGGEPVACSRGCSTCCHQRVHVTAPEVLELASWLRGESLEGRIGAIDAAAQRAKGRSSREHWESKIPCGLLEGGACVAYDARPLACRRGHSTSRAACESSFDGSAPSEARIPDNASVATNAALFELGFREGFEAAGLPLDVYELSGALAVALRDRDAEAKWLESRKSGAPDPFASARTYRADEV